MTNQSRLGKKAPFSLGAFWACVVFMLCCTALFYPRYQQQASNATLGWDAAGYYYYLPGAFIYHDLKHLDWADSVIRNYQPGPQTKREMGEPSDNGNTVLKYSSGVALVELPFFLVAHAVAPAFGYNRDGFALPYQMAIQYGALLISFLGLWLLRRFLLYYYSDGVVAVTLLGIVIGTNYLNYSAIDGALSHTWLFTLYAGLLLCTKRFYERPSAGRAAMIGLLVGWAALIRPTDIISCLIPLLWGVESIGLRPIQQRLRLFYKLRGKLALAAVIAVGVFSIQLVYWKAVSGHWLFYSYGEQGFDWLKPHTLPYLTDYRTGWLVYTPLMIVAVAGIIPFLKNGPNRVMVFCFLGIALYIVSAWHEWQYAGSGGRAMVQYYPLLTIPFAAMLQWLFAHRIRVSLAVPVLLILAYVNLWYTYHAHGGTLYDSQGDMSKEYYWRVIGRWKAPEETLKLRDGKYVYEGPLPPTAKLLYQNNLHGVNAAGKDTMLSIVAYDQSSPHFGTALQPGTAKWLRASATFHCPQKEWTSWKMLQFIMGVWKGQTIVRETMIRVHRFTDDGAVRNLSVDLRLPVHTDMDSVKVRFWNPGSDHAVYIEDLRIRAF